MRHAAQIELATVSVLWLFARPQPGGEGLDRIDDRLEADGFEQVERVLRPLQDQRVHGVTSGAAATIWSTELASPLATIEQLARQRVPPGFSAAEIATYLQGIGP